MMHRRRRNSNKLKRQDANEQKPEKRRSASASERGGRRRRSKFVNRDEDHRLGFLARPPPPHAKPPSLRLPNKVCKYPMHEPQRHGILEALHAVSSSCNRRHSSLTDMNTVGCLLMHDACCFDSKPVTCLRQEGLSSWIAKSR